MDFAKVRLGSQPVGLVLPLLLLLLCVSNEASARTARILGGVDTQPNEFRYQISVQNAKNVHVCGGAIIGEQYALSAAHCFFNARQGVFKKGPYHIVAGTNNLKSKNRVVMGVGAVYVPKVFSTYMNSDVALIKLSDRLDLNDDRLDKVELPEAGAMDDGYGAVLTGYGWTTPHGPASKKLLKAQALVIENQLCQSFYVSKIFPQHLCAYLVQQPIGVPQGFCNDDSGSPLVRNDVIIGIVSFNKATCDEKDGPGVYTRVSSLVGFIHKTMNDVVDAEVRRHIY